MELKTGITLTKKEIVSEEKTASHVGSGSAAVYSTPSMLLFMERTSMDLVQPYMAENHTTVGTAVNIRHLASTKVGEEVSCTAEVIEIDRKRIVFKLLVTNAEGKAIGDGTHDRFIVDLAKFL